MSDIVSLTDKRKKKEDGEEENVEVKQSTKESYDFEAIMKKNAENKSREAQDRKKNNRGVTRSYRLKH